MYKLYFEDKWEKRHFIDDIDDKEQAFAIFHQDLKNRYPNFKSYYTRSFPNEKGELIYDYGSHSEFYVLVKE